MRVTASRSSPLLSSCQRRGGSTLHRPATALIPCRLSEQQQQQQACSNSGRSMRHAVHATAEQQQQSPTEGVTSTVPKEREHMPDEDVHMPSGTRELHWSWTVPNSTLETRIRYFQAGSSGPPLLLLHGFGVGAYHFEHNMEELARSCRVFAVDILGQGCSWPVRPATAEDALYMSVDTWRTQLRDFATQVMGVDAQQPTYVAGNSLGGLLAVYLAAMHPELVRGVVLLNATPFWSFRPPLMAPSQGVWGLMPPGFGMLPVSSGLKGWIERFWWNNLRKPETIRSMLQLVYSHPGSVSEETVDRILAATQQPLALDVFSAIALAPKPELGFDECLKRIQAPVLMLYGREDPWVVPLWGKRLKRQVPKAIYLELSPAGHCPHHEVPRTVNWAITTFITSGDQPPVAEGASHQVEEEGGRVVTITNVGEQERQAPSNLLTRLLRLLDSLTKQQPRGEGG